MTPLAFLGFMELSIADILDIVLLGLIIFFLFRWIKGSSAMSIFIAIVSLYLIRVLVGAFNMRLMTAVPWIGAMGLRFMKKMIHGDHILRSGRMR